MSALLDMFPDKMRTNERKFVLERVEGDKVRRNDGTVDNTLFTGDNNLIAVFDPETNMWGLRYEKGTLPGAFKDQRFTQFAKLVAYVKNYYAKRGIEVKEIVD